METRKKDQYIKKLLGTIPSPENLNITGSKLPNKRQVLLCFLSNLKVNGRESALSTTIDELTMSSNIIKELITQQRVAETI